MHSNGNGFVVDNTNPTASMPRRRNRRGYVLLAVLAVVVLMVTALATLSKLSLQRALAAADASVRLQQRLGASSIERVLLPQASAVFDQFESQAEEVQKATGTVIPIPRQLRGVITMGGVTFDVVLADEDAKLNLNSLYHMSGPRRTQSAVTEIIGPAAGRALRMLPAVKPMKDEFSTSNTEDETNEGGDDPINEIPRAFRSWGEVFDLDGLSTALGNDAALPNVTTEITCWGGGGLNLRRASDASIQAAAASVLSEAGADRLVSRYRENQAMSLAILIQRETNSETERIRLRRMLSETSTHFSLWLDASAVARKSLRTFAVMRKTDDGTTLDEQFAF